MAAKKTKADDNENLSIQMAIRVTPSDANRISALAERFPVATRNAIARQALLIGLQAIEDQPMVLLGEKPKPKR